MIRTEKWDRKYLELAKYIANSWSKDPSSKVGTVLVNYEANLEFIGYNGLPRGVEDLDERLNNREIKHKMVVHAEVNAILKAGLLAKDSVLYIYPSFAVPNICNECAKYAIQNGVKEIVGYTPDLNNPRSQRWAESIEVAKTMLQEAGVVWSTLDET